MLKTITNIVVCKNGLKTSMELAFYYGTWPNCGHFQHYKTTLIIWNDSVFHIPSTIVIHKDCHFKIHNNNINVKL